MRIILRFIGLILTLGLGAAQAAPLDLSGFVKTKVQNRATIPVGKAAKAVIDMMKYEADTIVISNGKRRLFYKKQDGEVVEFEITVGRDGFRWVGRHTVTAMKEWPDWTPPPEMLQRRPDLPRHVAGGPDNPLGARAIYLGNTLYRIHGTRESETIGQAVSSGCFRMTNMDVIYLYKMVRVGTKVVVLP